MIMFVLNCLEISTARMLLARKHNMVSEANGCDSVPMKFKVETGAQINVIPITAFDTLADSHMNQLKPTQVRLTGYSGNTGTCRIECKLREKPHTLECCIPDTHATPILGVDSCRAMDW